MATEFSQEQLIAQELAKLQQRNSNMSDQDNEVSEVEIYKKLSAPFPKEAYSKDSSRGFNLTSLKAQYVIERLNEVLGLLNWSHGGEYEVTADGGVLFKGALIITINGKQNRFFGTGYSAGSKKNLGDSYKGAKTDSLSKCASQIGVGNEVFKGLIDPVTFEKVSKSDSVKTVEVSQNDEVSESAESNKSNMPSMFKLKSSQKLNNSQEIKGLKKGL